MNKYLLILILPLLTLGMTACDDNEDVVIAPDLDLFAGTWEVVDQGTQEVFERNCILDIKSRQIYEGYGGYQGYITTFFLTADGITTYDRVYTWSIREVENHKPLLEVVFQGELDSDDLWAGEYHYKISKLTDTDMWWQVNTISDNSTIKFKRRKLSKPID